VCGTPEDDGLTRVTLMFDTETLLQTGSVLLSGDDLLATYYFRDVKLNPKFDADHFSPERLK
jgi:outer membrane lipoprotein-sorting protein